jgi:hypothetical protein
VTPPLAAPVRPGPNDAASIAPRDRVLLPDGRTGEVIGFYRTADDVVLVRLQNGESRRFVRAYLTRA